MSVKVKVRCPACPTTLSWELPDDAELWGQIDPTDVGCMSVTRVYGPEAEAHIDVHRRDGTLVAASLKHYERVGEIYRAAAERIRELTTSQEAKR